MILSVLVTGGAGYIGSHMVWHLLDQGEDVVVLDNLSTGFDWLVPKDAELVVGDIADVNLVDTVLRERKVESVLHFAGSVVVPESVVNPLGYYLNNTSKSRDLLEVSIRCGVQHFLFSSTAAVYGTTGNEPVSETSQLRPETPYGRSKRMTELMLSDAAAAHDLSITILRYFNVAGADPLLRTGQSTRGATHLIKAVSEAATGKRNAIEIFGTDYPTDDGTCIRDFIHVADLVELHALALQRMRGGGSGLTANCGYGVGYSVRQVIEIAKRVTGSNFTVLERPRRQGDLISVVANPSLARQEFNWKPSFASLETIIEHAVRWEDRLLSLSPRVA